MKQLPSASALTESLEAVASQLGSASLALRQHRISEAEARISNALRQLHVAQDATRYEFRNE